MKLHLGFVLVVAVSPFAMSHPVLVTGAAGFIGAAVIDELLARHIPANALVHRKRPAPKPGLLIVSGNISDASALDHAMEGCHAVIHLVGIIREDPHLGIAFQKIHVEGTQSVVAAARRAGIRRFIHMSAQGARAGAVAEYHRTKFAAEQCVEQSGLDWTIFRPSLIHGPNGEFMAMESAWAKGKAAPYLFMPYFGSGLFGLGGGGKIQPVFVGDVARAFIDALDNPKSSRQIYPLGGADELTWPQMHRLVAQGLLGHSRLALPIPAWYARLLTRIVPATMLPFNRDQVIMSQEDNTCDMPPFNRDFGWTPRSFVAALREYLQGPNDSPAH